jgi:hypothetical protein
MVVPDKKEHLMANGELGFSRQMRVAKTIERCAVWSLERFLEKVEKFFVVSCFYNVCVLKFHRYEGCFGAWKRQPSVILS